MIWLQDLQTGKTAMHCVVEKGDLRLLQGVLHLLKDNAKDILNQTMHNNDTCLHVAAQVSLF